MDQIADAIRKPVTGATALLVRLLERARFSGCAGLVGLL